MRPVAIAIVLTGALGFAPATQAQCEKCPKGFTFWHSKEACLADDGSGAQTEPLYWKHDHARAGATLYQRKLGGRSGGNAGPAASR